MPHTLHPFTTGCMGKRSRGAVKCSRGLYRPSQETFAARTSETSPRFDSRQAARAAVDPAARQGPHPPNIHARRGQPARRRPTGPGASRPTRTCCSSVRWSMENRRLPKHRPRSARCRYEHQSPKKDREKSDLSCRYNVRFQPWRRTIRPATGCKSLLGGHWPEPHAGPGSSAIKSDPYRRTS